MREQTVEIKNHILSSSHLPTAKEMKKFSEKYTKTEWATLCDNREFLLIFDKDLKEAKRLADEIFTVGKEEEKKVD